MSSEAGGVIVGLAAGAAGVTCAAFVLTGGAGVTLAVETTAAAALAAKGLYLLSADLGKTLARERAAALQRRRVSKANAARRKAHLAERRALAELEAHLEALETTEQARLMLADEITQARATAAEGRASAELEDATRRLNEATETALRIAAAGEAQMVELVAAGALAATGFEDISTARDGARTTVTGFRGGQVATVSMDGSRIGVDIGRSGFDRQSDCDRTLEDVLAELARHGLVIEMGPPRRTGGAGIAAVLARAAGDVAGGPVTIETAGDETVIRASVPIEDEA